MILYFPFRLGGESAVYLSKQLDDKWRDSKLSAEMVTCSIVLCQFRQVGGICRY
jgi:hypothetical protein